MGGNVARMGKCRGAYCVLLGKPGRTRPLGRPRNRWKDIRTDLKEIGWFDTYCIYLAQDRGLTGCDEHGNEPSGWIKCGEFLD